jgi:hypothetical protein
MVHEPIRYTLLYACVDLIDASRLYAKRIVYLVLHTTWAHSTFTLSSRPSSIELSHDIHRTGKRRPVMEAAHRPGDTRQDNLKHTSGLPCPSPNLASLPWPAHVLMQLSRVLSPLHKSQTSLHRHPPHTIDIAIAPLARSQSQQLATPSSTHLFSWRSAHRQPACSTIEISPKRASSSAVHMRLRRDGALVRDSHPRPLHLISNRRVLCPCTSPDAPAPHLFCPPVC